MVNAECCLTKVGLEVRAVAHTTTATARCTIVCAEVGAFLRASGTVDEFVACKAGDSTATTLEDTSVHV